MRYLLSKQLNPVFDNFYLGTFTVNIIGSLLIGFLIGFELKYIMSKPYLLLLVTGFCGGFTTFSAFALENYLLLKEGQMTSVFLNIGLSVILGVLFVFLGFYIAKQLFNT
jgi:CrcB protein